MIITVVKARFFARKMLLLFFKPVSSVKCITCTLSTYRKSIKACEFGYGNAIFAIIKKKTYGKEVLLDGV